MHLGSRARAFEMDGENEKGRKREKESVATAMEKAGKARERNRRTEEVDSGRARECENCKSETPDHRSGLHFPGLHPNRQNREKRMVVERLFILITVPTELSYLFSSGYVDSAK